MALLSCINKTGDSNPKKVYTYFQYCVPGILTSLKSDKVSVPQRFRIKNCSPSLCVVVMTTDAIHLSLLVVGRFSTVAAQTVLGLLG